MSHSSIHQALFANFPVFTTACRKDTIDCLLDEITVCDPAIGSGAFPVGMMQEIVKARLTLGAVEGMPTRTAYNLKRHAIENSLYGVDIDPGAIEIARLRLWLSLVVDEDDFKRIHPLPNLDYKVMQGNSLLEEFEGVKLIQDSLILQAFHGKEAQITELNNQINQLEREAVIAGSREGKRSPEFLKLQDDLTQRKKQRDALYLQDDKPQLQMGLLDSSKLLGERLSELEKLRQRYLDYHSISEKKNELREEIEIKEWEIVEQVLTDQGKKDALRELARHRRDNRKNYFLWKFYFSQVFRGKGGFDVVIGNPPYLNVERVSPETKSVYAANFQTFYKRYDVFGLFFEQALTRLVTKGSVAFIVPSQILNNLSYKKLRDLILSNGWLKEVFYLGDKIFESANNDVCVLFLQKPKAEKIRLANALNLSSPTVTEVAADYFDRFEKVISFSADVASDSIFDKIFNQGFPRLRESFDVFQGIVTGNNEAFLPTEEQIRSAHLEKNLLHSILLGRDFEKWYIRNSERKILYVDVATEIEKYPNAKAWLLPFRSQLKKRRECERGIIPWFALQWARNKSQLDWTPKLLIQRTRNPRLKTRIVATLDEVGFYAMESVILIVPGDALGSIKYLLGIINSKLINYLYQTRFLNVAVKAEYLKETPIALASSHQQTIIARLVDYIVFSKANLSEDASRDQLMVSYFEQLIDALVYELYMPDEIHTAGKQFFAPLIAERLPALDEIKGDKLATLRQIFERLYDRNHIIRQNIFFLDTIESVRIIEGKA